MPPDDGRRMAYAAEQHVARRSAHGPFRLARNRRQPSADHLLFPAGHGRAVDQRRNCRLPKKHLPSFARRTAVLLGAGILAVGSNFAPLWYTMHHSKQTIRGGSNSPPARKPPRKGWHSITLRRGATDAPRAWNLLIPDFMGGDSGRAFTRDGEMAKALKPYGLESFAEQLPAYWGEQPYTAGPTYLGAAALFLALLGLLLASGRNKWWIAAVSLLTLLLAWGHNFMDSPNSPSNTCPATTSSAPYRWPSWWSNGRFPCSRRWL